MLKAKQIFCFIYLHKNILKFTDLSISLHVSSFVKVNRYYYILIGKKCLFYCLHAHAKNLDFID